MSQNRQFKWLSPSQRFLHRRYTAFWYIIDAPFCLHRRITYIYGGDRIRPYPRCIDCGFHFPYGWRHDAEDI